MPAATVTIEISTSTDIFTHISCKLNLSDGTVFITPYNNKVGFFQTTKRGTGILCLTFLFVFFFFFINCNIQMLISNVSQG